MSRRSERDRAWPLEPSGDEMRALVDAAMERIVRHVASLPEQPASASEGGAELARSLAEALPEDGTPFEEILDLLFDRAVPCSFNTAGPGYLAYIPSGGIFHSALADLISASFNRYVGVWLAAPGLVQLEVNVVRWLCEIVGFPAGSGGVLTSGGSMANLIAVVTARRERLPERFLDGVLYASDQVHHSVKKAAVLAGFPPSNVREVPSDERFRLRVDELDRLIEQDRREGLTPFLVVASAGTTNTGAVDDLEALADLAEHQRLWLHVDAAYGGVFALTERGRRVLRGLERVDSVTLDPHKGLFLPYGNGALLMHDPEALRRAHSTHADYMPPMQDDPDLVDFCEISPELSRDFRGLRAWLPIKLLGIDVFRRQLGEKLDLTLWAAEELRRIPGVEVFGDPPLSLVVFRLVRPGLDGDALNALNRELLDRVNRRQRVFLTPTTLSGNRFVLRICVLSFRTHRERMEMALEDVRAVVDELADGAEPTRGDRNPA